MLQVVIISERGQITLPINLRKKYRLEKNIPIVLEETDDGLLLRKADMLPIRVYSKKEIEAWKKGDQLKAKDKTWKFADQEILS